MKKYLYFNQDFLKLIALGAMTLDHLGKILFIPDFTLMILVGRIAFPIFSYLIMLHLFEKKCFKQYFVRLFAFGMITGLLLIIQNESPNNILWTFFVAIACVWLMGKAEIYFKDVNIRLIFQILAFIFCFVVSLGADYSIFGFCYLLSLYGFFKFRTPLFVILSLLFGALINPTMPIQAAISLVTTGILLFNNPNKNDKRYIHNKWLFYIYYPAHLSVLYALKALGIVF